MSPSLSTTPSSAPSLHDQQATKENHELKRTQTDDTLDLKSPAFWTVILAVYAAIFLVALDRLIIAAAIPSITNEFNSISDIAWYGSAYMITCAIFQPLFGRIYQQYSIKWGFLASLTIFEIGSAVCGSASSSTIFIIGRAIAGIGGAGIQSGGMMIIIPLVPLHKRPVFVSFFGLAFGISSVIGPLIGGAFTDSPHLTWRWCFYVNLPIGAFTILATLLFLRLPSAPHKKLSVLDQVKRLDPLGMLFFIPAMISLLLALQWGGASDPWSSPKIIGLLVTFAVTLLIFMTIEGLLPESAVMPYRVVLQRSVAGAMVFIFLLMGGMMLVAYYLTIWFQVAQGQSAIDSGIHTIPLLLAMTLTGILAAIFVQKIGYYVPNMILCSVLASTGAGLISTLTPSATPGFWIGYQILYGVGIGTGFQVATLAPQNVLAKEDVSIGMAMMFFMQQLGGSIFLSVGQNVLQSQLVNSLSGIAGLDAKIIINTGATELRRIVPAGALDAVVSAYSYSLTRTFVVAAALSACMLLGALVIEWKSIKKDKQDHSKMLTDTEAGRQSMTPGSVECEEVEADEHKAL